MAIYIGQFNEEQCRKSEDKAIVEKKIDETGLRYTKTRLVKKGSKIVGLKVWLLTEEEYYNSNEF